MKSKTTIRGTWWSSLLGNCSSILALCSVEGGDQFNMMR